MGQKKGTLLSLDVDIMAETKRQIEEINAYRRKGEKLNLSMVVNKMLALWNRVK